MAPASAPTAGSEGAAQDALLATDGLPVWLSPGRFLSADFDAEACVADLRRYVPLATLQNELNSYLATLKTKLVEVLNEDYSEYVGLSGRLTNVEGAVARMRKPLVELKDKLQAVHGSVKAELITLNQGLRRRKEVGTQRGLLELLQEVVHVAGKVEKLLEEVAAADSGSSGGAGIVAASAGQAGGAGHAGGADASSVPSSLGSSSAGQPQQPDLLSHCRLLERVAAEVSRLNFLATRGKELAFVRALEPRIAAYRAALTGRLSAALAAALSAHRGDPAAALHCLAAYADMGEGAPGDAAAIVRTAVVAPLVERLIRDHKSAGAGGGHGAALAALLGAVLSGVRQELGPLLEATLAAGSALRAVDLLGASVVEELQGALAAALPGVFSPGVPPAFHANYLAMLAWLAQLEGLCTTRAAVERLRACPAYTTLMRRWNTSVYFSLVFQETAGDLEEALGVQRLEKAAPAAGAPPDAPPLQLAATAALLRCLRRAASRDVVLPPLVDRFLRLALQLAARYASWVEAGVEARREAAAASASNAQGVAAAVSPAAVTVGPAGAAAAAGAGPAVGGPGAAPAAGQGTGLPCAWMAALPADELAAVIHDSEAAADFLEGAIGSAFMDLAGTLSPAVAPPGAVAAGVRAAFGEAAAAVRAAGRGLAAAVTEEVVEKCVAVVRQLKGITATYRMTSKGPPSRHSHYVMGVLQPLRALLDSAGVRLLPQPLKQELFVVAVADSVCNRYASLAEELLVSVRKTENSLKRLKKAKATGDDVGAAPGGEAISDSDKITLQLHLDVLELGSQLAGAYGLPDPAAALPGFKRLQEVVVPPPGLLPAAP